MMSDESEQSRQGGGTEGDSETDMTTSSDSSSSQLPPPMLMAYSFDANGIQFCTYCHRFRELLGKFR